MENSVEFTQEERRARIVQYARSEFHQNLIERDRGEIFEREFWRKCVGLGLAALPIDPDYGGEGASLQTTVALLEAFGYGCPDNGLVFALGAHLWACEIPLQAFGTPDQKTKYLPLLTRGDWIGAHCVSETGAGSDAFQIATTASATGVGYVLNGHKRYITGAPVADLFLILTTIDPTAGPRGLTAFLVEKNTPGLRTVPTSKMGLRTVIMGEVFLEDCVVPKENMLGRPGSGMAIFHHAMEWERAFILSGAVGAMARVLEQTVAHAKSRQQFGSPIGKFQAVSHKLVDMKLRLETARALLYQAARKKDAGESIHMEAALVKYQISESWVANCLDAMQVHGAAGYVTGPQIERELRDALGARVFSGTSEIQKNIVAGFMGL